ncbi:MULTISPECIES: trypsin-like serine protease [unclassified Nocardia]|uniref:trypsin-like serine protease n=1 Tax=Nocardia sp. JCM 34519.1 TaxID=2876119 RepID=UPI001CE45A57
MPAHNSASGERTGACRGDDGGPLVAYKVLIGLYSWRNGCGTRGYPDIYTRIGDLRTWIDNNRSGQPHKSGTNTACRRAIRTSEGSGPDLSASAGSGNLLPIFRWR